MAHGVSERTTTNTLPRVLDRPEHDLSRKRISTSAIKVLYRLHRAGYLAYLVGGGVRDLLIGRTPKDFDVGTNARPGEVRRLFRNSRIIGRRFRLVHVFFKDEIVEVSTFRASPDAPEGPDDWEEGLQEERDADDPDEPARGAPRETEAYGTPREDAWRRDLTINSLFYNIADFSVIDWAGGLEDLEDGIIRVIGDPENRFEQDPVRMMRALEYAVRLGFAIEQETEAAIQRCAGLITEASPARLTYELMECLRSGHAAGIWTRWRRHGILDAAFPDLVDSLGEIDPILARVDDIIRSGDRLSDAAILAALYLPRFASLLEESTREGRKLDNPQFIDRLSAMLEPASTTMLATNHALHLMSHGLFALTKMRRPPERGRQVIKLVRHESFPVTWSLFQIGAATGLLSEPSRSAWAKAVARVRKAPPGEEPELVVDTVRRTRRRPRRRPRRRRKGS
jgi:poly(A) polymerase